MRSPRSRRGTSLYHGGGGNCGTSGGGGGGSGYFSGGSPRGKGGNGGSGVVIIKYPDLFNEPTSTTGSPTVTNTGGYRIYKFTSSGTITFT